MEKTELKQRFEEIFGRPSEAEFFSPGRINLIGEHTDYNGGHVFPCAITLGTYGAAAKRDDQTLRFYSENFADEGIIEVPLADLHFDKADKWTNYPKGMIHFLKEAGHKIDTGMDVYVNGNIPNGSGLSSSASLELLMGVILQHLFDLDLERLDLVKIGMKTENDFIGVNSGIMDQFAVGMGQENKAILLDTNTLKYDLVPLDLKDNVIVIMNTNKRRELADSKYNERRSECETALEAEDLEKFGRLVNASHVSLEHDYEVTGKELDTLAHTAWQQPGVLGARMTGAGFGGCGIALVNKADVEAFKENVGKVYEEKIGYAPAFYIAEIADGTKKL